MSISRVLRVAVPGLVSLLALAACSAGGGGSSDKGDGGGGGQGGQTTGSTGSGLATGSTSTSGSGGGSSVSSGTGASAGSGGSSAFDCKSLPLCDDFEGASAGAPPDAAKWSVVMPNCSGKGTLTVDGAMAHGGTKSVRVDGKGGYCDHVFIANTSAIGGVGPVVYGRYFMRVSAAQGDGHTTFMSMKDANDNGKELRMGGQSKILMWNRESDDATLPELSPSGIAMSVALPPATWLCVEFKVDGPAGMMQTWIDGKEVMGLHLDDMPTKDVDGQWLNKKGWKPNLVDFKLGWESYAGQEMSLWFDDVALGPTRIGCD